MSSVKQQLVLIYPPSSLHRRCGCLDDGSTLVDHDEQQSFQTRPGVDKGGLMNLVLVPSGAYIGGVHGVIVPRQQESVK